MRARFMTVVLVAVFLAWPSRSHAGHHLWRFSQMFSNASGSTQFVQLFTTDSGEPGVGPFSVTAGGSTFNFVTNLPSSNTANTWILIATSDFASLPGGVAPDYVIPSHFFATGGGTLGYASGVDSWAYGTVPTDGVHSLMRDGTTAVNAPTNFAGVTGSVNLSPAVPAIPRAGLAVLVGALLLGGSGLLRRRRAAI